MSDLREALQEAVEYLNGDHGQNSIGTGSILHRKMQAALSANGGEAVPFGYVDPKVYNKGAVGGGISKTPTDTRTKPVWAHPAPPSVEVPENEIKARALEEYADQLDAVFANAQEAGATDCPAWHAGQFAKDARKQATRLRTAGDEGEE